MRNVNIPLYTFEELSQDVQDKIVNNYIEKYDFASEYATQNETIKDISKFLLDMDYPLKISTCHWDSNIGEISVSADSEHDFDLEALGDFLFHSPKLNTYHSEVMRDSEFYNTFYDAEIKTPQQKVDLINELLKELLITFQYELEQATDDFYVKCNFKDEDLEYFKDGTIFNPELLEE